jgi:hypothetical protein
LRPLHTTELLRVWEAGLKQPILEKTFSLLATACSSNAQDMGHLSIGERDARLLQLREWTFGSRLQNIVKCPVCRALVEWESSTSELHLQPITSDPTPRTFDLERDSLHIRFRLPDSFDIAQAATRSVAKGASSSDTETSKAVLEGCILEMSDQVRKSPELSEEIMTLLSDRMAVEDPQANIQIQLSCPNCSHRWEAIFDIVSFLWSEIDNWAKRILHEVYLLARAFGWSEGDILEMSARRRHLYIQMIGK